MQIFIFHVLINLLMVTWQSGASRSVSLVPDYPVTFLKHFSFAGNLKHLLVCFVLIWEMEQIIYDDIDGRSKGGATIVLKVIVATEQHM